MSATAPVVAVGIVGVVKLSVWFAAVGPVTVSTPDATAAPMPSPESVALLLMLFARVVKEVPETTCIVVAVAPFRLMLKGPSTLVPVRGPSVADAPALLVAAVGVVKAAADDPTDAEPPLEFTHAWSALAMVLISAVGTLAGR